MHCVKSYDFCNKNLDVTYVRAFIVLKMTKTKAIVSHFEPLIVVFNRTLPTNTHHYHCNFKTNNTCIDIL